MGAWGTRSAKRLNHVVGQSRKSAPLLRWGLADQSAQAGQRHEAAAIRTWTRSVDSNIEHLEQQIGIDKPIYSQCLARSHRLQPRRRAPTS